jgi:hypothetical protein
MSLKTRGFLALTALVLSAAACKELPGTADLEGSLQQMEPMPYTDAIPAEWGRLISVTADAAWTYSTMWFQDDSGTIRLVGFYNENRQLLDSVVVIDRR